MLEKTVTIGDKEVKFRSSATIPRLYRIKFKRDIFKDLSKLEASYSKKKNEDGSFAIEDLEIFENVAYIMATMPTAPSRTTSMTGSISLKCSPSMRCCRRFWNCGVPIW